MLDQNTKRALKKSLLIASLAAIFALFGAYNLMKIAYKENPEYAEWQMLPDEQKKLQTEDGLPVFSKPEKELPLTGYETIVLGAGVASFAFLPTLFICFRILKRNR